MVGAIRKTALPLCWPTVIKIRFPINSPTVCARVADFRLSTSTKPYVAVFVRCVWLAAVQGLVLGRCLSDRDTEAPGTSESKQNTLRNGLPTVAFVLWYTCSNQPVRCRRSSEWRRLGFAISLRLAWGDCVLQGGGGLGGRARLRSRKRRCSGCEKARGRGEHVYGLAGAGLEVQKKRNYLFFGLWE